METMNEYNPLDPSHNIAYFIEEENDPVLALLSDFEKKEMCRGTMPSMKFQDGTYRFITIGNDYLSKKLSNRYA